MREKDGNKEARKEAKKKRRMERMNEYKKDIIIFYGRKEGREGRRKAGRKSEGSEEDQKRGRE